MNMASVVDLFPLKPCYSSLFDIRVSSLSFKILVKSLMLVFSSIMPLKLFGCVFCPFLNIGIVIILCHFECIFDVGNILL